MYQLSKIQDALLHLVGFEQDLNPAMHIDDELTQSESGLHFQAAHPLVTLTNIKQNMPIDWLYQYNPWTEEGVYNTGDIVLHNNEVWQSLSDNNTGNTPQEGAFWTVYNYFNDYLTKIIREGIASTVQRFVRDKMVNRLAPNIIERKAFFDGAGYIYDRIPNNNKIVGFEIVPRRAMGITTKIERIGLQMRGAAGQVTIYLFHSSLINPVKTQTVTVGAGGSFQWFTVNDWYLPYIGENDAGGSWYVAYDQRGLPTGAEAIDSKKDFSKSPKSGCTTCGGLKRYAQTFSDNLEFYPFSNDGSLTTPEMWDVTRNIYPGCVNYGMNIEITVGCDLTDFIISQRNIFATCLQKQTAANILKRMAFNPDDRVNRSQLKISAERINYDLEGEAGRRSAFAVDLEAEFKGLELNTRGIDHVCLPCKNRGIRYTNA